MNDQIWSGSVVVTGDVTIEATVTVQPGTAIMFAPEPKGRSITLRVGRFGAGGSLILADGLILGQNGAVGNGGLHLIEPGPGGYKELAKVGLLALKGDEPWAPLALGDGKLLARNGQEMICVDVQNP